MRSLRNHAAWLLPVLLASTACSVSEGAASPPPAPEDVAGRTVLYLAPGPENDPSYLPAYRGAQVAAALAELRGDLVSVVWVDVSSPSSGWEIPIGDAALVAPGMRPGALGRLADRIDVPVVSLAGSGAPGWWVLGPDRAEVTAALLRMAGERTCVVVDGTTDRSVLPRDAGIRRIGADVAIRDVGALGDCSAILWTGGPEGAASLRVALDADGLRAIPFIGTDLLRDGSYEAAAGRAGRGTLIVSGAADVAMRIDLRSRRFVQSYQAEVGLAPGPFSAEAFDAVRILLETLDAGGWPAVHDGVSGRLTRTRVAGPDIVVYRLGAARWRPVR